MHRILNALACLAFIISYAPDAGFAVLGPVFDRAPPWAGAAFGAALLLAPPGLKRHLHPQVRCARSFRHCLR